MRKVSLLILILLYAVNLSARDYSASIDAVPASSGSAKYRQYAGEINLWRTSVTDALASRAVIAAKIADVIDAAGRDEITDAEYSALAVPLHAWVTFVAREGAAGDYGTNIDRGWTMSWLVDPSLQTGDCCVWELVGDAVPFYTGTGTLNVPDGAVMLLFTNSASAKIVRGEGNPAVMIKTAGSGKVIFFGTDDHRVILDGGRNRTEPTSCSQVNLRTDYESSDGQLVFAGGGTVLSAYTAFQNNAAGSGMQCIDTGMTYLYHGGAVFLGGNVSASFYKTDVRNNSARTPNMGSTTFGGGVGIYSVENTRGIFFNQCVIRGNHLPVQGHGGGVGCYFDRGASPAAVAATIVFRDTEFSYNCQSGAGECHGGGLFYHDQGNGREARLYDCTFKNNYAHGATAGGGGISNEGHITLQGCVFDRNIADNTMGGAIYARPGLDITGGNKFIDLTIDGCTFSSNSAIWTGDLGGNYADGDPERGSGGAIMVELRRMPSGESDDVSYKVDMDIVGNSYFTGNSADRNGGAVAIVLSDNLLPFRTAHPDKVESTLKMTSVTMLGNRSGTADAAWTGSGRHNNGGAIYLSGTSLTMNPSGNAGVMVAWNSAVGNGGSMAIYNAPFSMTAGTFLENIAAGSGGGVYVDGGNVDIADALIEGCVATAGNGGGVAVKNGHFTVNGVNSAVIGTSAKPNRALAGHGGGFYVDGGNVTVSNASVAYNLASLDGGGFYSTDGVVTVSSNAAVDHNAAGRSGGGMYVTGSNAVIAIDNSSVSDNTASMDGGAVYVTGNAATVTLSNGCIVENNTSVNANGGAFYGGANTTVTVNGGSVNDNKALNGNGGGVYSNGGTVSFNGGDLTDNMAMNGGGVYLTNGADMTYREAGFICQNQAIRKDASPLASAYQGNALPAEAVIQGLGGGVYLAHGTGGNTTTLTFNIAGLTSTDEFGFYNNYADAGGDDIFAEGLNTSITVPDISNMSLQRYSYPHARLFWHEDYITDDVNYQYGTDRKSLAAPVRRYRESRDAVNSVWSVPDIHLGGYASRYLALTLGYDFESIRIRREGLVAGENAIFTITDGGSFMQRVLVNGTSAQWDEVVVARLVNGTYTVTESGWTWHNTDKSAWAMEKTQPVDSQPVFEFSNSHVPENAATTPGHDESRVDNTLEPAEYDANL